MCIHLYASVKVFNKFFYPMPPPHKEEEVAFAIHFFQNECPPTLKSLGFDCSAKQRQDKFKAFKKKQTDIFSKKRSGAGAESK